MNKGNFRVRCIDLCESNPDIYTVGKIYEVIDGWLISDTGSKIGTGRFKDVDDVNKFSSSEFVSVNDNKTIVIYTKDNETIATLKQGKEVIKTTKAKCSPRDEFNFEIGAKLAFQRLLGEDKPTYREVKRPAKVGEWIKVVDGHPIYPQNYKNGDIFKVIKQDCFCDGDVKVDKVNDSFIDKCEYVVLENYQPQPKTLSDYTNRELAEELLRRFSE